MQEEQDPGTPPNTHNDERQVAPNPAHEGESDLVVFVSVHQLPVEYSVKQYIKLPSNKLLLLPDELRYLPRHDRVPDFAWKSPDQFCEI